MSRLSMLVAELARSFGPQGKTTESLDDFRYARIRKLNLKDH